MHISEFKDQTSGLIDGFSAGYEKRNQPNDKNLHLQSILLTRYADALAAQSMWKWPTNIYFKLSPIPWEGSHAVYCLDC